MSVAVEACQTAVQRSQEFEMTQADFQKIASILYDEAGIVLSSSKTALVYSRLTKRLRALKMSSFKEYCIFLAEREGKSERQHLLTSLTTNVTHFFREKHHFEHFKSDLLPSLMERARAGQRVRLWSAGCSSGQEPYSLAMTLLNGFPDVSEHDVRILATDIDPAIVAKARVGQYAPAIVEPVPGELRNQFLIPKEISSGTIYDVVKPVRNLITFHELNLLKPWPMRGQFDAIFCRNVVIYFDETTQRGLWGRFREVLRPDGILYIGHSERITGPTADQFSTVGVTTFQRTT